MYTLGEIRGKDRLGSDSLGQKGKDVDVLQVITPDTICKGCQQSRWFRVAHAAYDGAANSYCRDSIQPFAAS